MKQELIKTQNQPEAKLQPLQKALFISWEELDRQLKFWSRDYFGIHVCLEPVSENKYGGAVGIELCGLTPNDRERFEAVYEVYDPEKEHEIEFAVGFQISSFPEKVAKKLFFDIIPNHGLSSFETMIAFEHGVVVSESNVEILNRGNFGEDVE